MSKIVNYVTMCCICEVCGDDCETACKDGSCALVIDSNEIEKKKISHEPIDPHLDQ